MRFSVAATVDEPVRQSGAARTRLREATAEDHAAVDAVYSAFDLSDMKDYRAFLSAQYAGLAWTEDSITEAGPASLLPDWHDRLRAHLLACDLQQLGAPPSKPGRQALALPGPAALLGAVYVLEGSRFGGAMLARRLPAGAPARFLGAAAHPQAWRRLIAALDRHLEEAADMDAATTAARAVFDAFAEAGRRQLEAAIG